MGLSNRIYEAFDNIKASPSMKETTKQFLAEKRERKPTRRFRPVYRGALAAACMALVLTAGVFGYSWIQTPVSYVSIDVNPSLELALNRFDKVVSAAAYNEEGEEILQGLSLEGKVYTEAIDEVIESEIMEQYLTKEAELVFTVAAEGSREEELKAGVESCSDQISHSSEHVSADLGSVTEAHEHGISLGKYNAYLQLQQYDSAVTVEECKHMSINEIHGLMHAHERGECQENGSHGQGGGGHGQGHHHGTYESP